MVLVTRSTTRRSTLYARFPPTHTWTLLSVRRILARDTLHKNVGDQKHLPAHPRIHTMTACTQHHGLISTPSAMPRSLLPMGGFLVHLKVIVERREDGCVALDIACRFPALQNLLDILDTLLRFHHLEGGLVRWFEIALRFECVAHPLQKSPFPVNQAVGGFGIGLASGTDMELPAGRRKAVVILIPLTLIRAVGVVFIVDN